MHDYPSLDLAWSDVKNQSELYQPTCFWSTACSQIRQELLDNGVEHFRRLPSALSFFVPTYGAPGNGLSAATITDIKQSAGKNQTGYKARLEIEQFLSGELAALADYRTLLAADNRELKPWLHKFNECSYGNPVEQFSFEGRRFSRSSLNYLLGLALVKRHLEDMTSIRVLEIGGGFGTLGEILAYSGLSEWQYINIDIPPNSFIAENYLSQAVKGIEITGYAETRSMDQISIGKLGPVSSLCSWQIGKLTGEIDLFVNFISFQEMEPHVVHNYLSHVDRLNTNWILLRNMREGKQVKKSDQDVGVKEPTTSRDYISFLTNYELVERNVLPFGLRTADGYHSELLLFKRNN